MAKSTFQLKDLPPQLAQAISTAPAGDEVIIMDGETEIGRIVSSPRSGGIRILGLHPGAMQTTDDFDAPMPEEVWERK